MTRDRSGSLFGWWAPSHAPAHAPASVLHSPRARPSHPHCLCRCRAVAPPSRPCAAVDPLRCRCCCLAFLCAALSPLGRADGQRLRVRTTGTGVAGGLAHRDRRSCWCGLPCCTPPRAPARLVRSRSLCGACWGGCWRRWLAPVVGSGGSGSRLCVCLRAGRALACTVGAGGGGGHGLPTYPRRWLEALITKGVCTCVTMTRCLLCGFDSGAQSGHTQVSCALRSFPCRRTLAVGNVFKRHKTACSDLTCPCHLRCTSCNQMGHTNRTLVIDGVNYRSGNCDSILRRDKAPPLCGADYVCTKILDAQVDGFRAAAVADYQKKLADKARLAGVADELVGNTADTGLDATEAFNLMDAQGMGGATMTTDNREHWEKSTRLLQDPSVSAVDAALGACAVPSAAVAAQRRAQAAGDGLPAASANSPDAVAWRETPDSARGGSRSSAAKLFAVHNASVSDAGLDVARRLSMTGSASSPFGSRSGSAAGGAPGRSMPSEAPAVATAKSPFTWPEGARETFDRQIEPFELPSLSVMDAEQLAVAAHVGAFKDMATHTPDLKTDFVNGARANMLIGVMITCGVVTPARFAEQMCSTRTTKPNTNILMMLATWLSKVHRDAVAPAGETRGRKRRRRPATSATADEEDTRGSMVDSCVGSGVGSGTGSSEERVYDVDEPVGGSGGSM